jgi:hypothetical protein
MFEYHMFYILYPFVAYLLTLLRSELLVSLCLGWFVMRSGFRMIGFFFICCCL